MTNVLELTGVSKTFDDIRVLHDVTLAVGPGEILGLIGENGSGKSTLIKILSGYHAADPGAEIRAGGMAFVHQDLALVASMTVLENLRIARFRTGFGWRIRWSTERAGVKRFLDQVGLDVHPDTRVGDLSVTEQALVAVARGLADIDETGNGQRLLVLDEPTAYLPRDGVERLFGVLRDLTAQGASAVFVSHRLDEVRELCDRVAVLRGGELVATVDAADKTERDLLELMLGRSVEDLYPDTASPEGEPWLTVEGLGGGALRELSFTARPGEIIGFAGLPGSGYDEVPYLLTGARRATGGTVQLDDRSVSAATLRPRAAIDLGMALLPADRARAGGAAALTVRENLTLPSLPAFTRFRSVVSRGRERKVAMEQSQRYAVTPRRPESALRFLSGGNQQKVLLAKWMLGEPRVLALHEPTQGVDVGAKREIFAHLSAAAAAGAVVLLSTVEHEDLAHLCGRVHVLRGGRCVRVIEGGELTPGRLAEAVYAS
ncbi:sugar ABC transporter ATP-binding protein [Asanoa ishikariensis]|uniref:Monosaccharide ABC transporter ATP-binding protein, CUT2 family n=1 Tax=Asanoa ishikariensis TaxID=137265 RepID=A0A1H3S123_9ACTN|nr:sugar ABC transporter ATP-binding protein [Asanoa ishikariensis]GIF66612.1 sugar ABC transporter ATP-binding protein [Asanoa ishikariensis]SDZ31622.1 monosaccharide ABC transporter ATP-binding protein, CUT2 family [Asanoa ishikariensis]